MNRASSTITVGSVLESQHRQIEDWIRQLIRPGGLHDVRGAEETLQGLASMLRRRFEVEERLAFPRFEKESGLHEAGPTLTLRREHREIERRLEQIAGMLASSSPPDVLSQLEAFSTLVADHVRREESVLWDVCERLLDEPDRAESLRILLQDGTETR